MNRSNKKMDYYAKMIAEMEHKYVMDFSAFEKRIHLRVGEKDFKELDDFILWESYIKVLKYWEHFL